MKKVVFVVLMLVMVLAFALPVLADGPPHFGECPDVKGHWTWKAYYNPGLENFGNGSNNDGWVCYRTPFPSATANIMWIDNKVPLGLGTWDVLE